MVTVTALPPMVSEPAVQPLPASATMVETLEYNKQLTPFIAVLVVWQVTVVIAVHERNA
tara:strand:- start:101 stop:277 length:177 start_codon:yes stop_codon:yes gene_type:complete